jgi:hypothetical protein
MLGRLADLYERTATATAIVSCGPNERLSVRRTPVPARSCLHDVIVLVKDWTAPDRPTFNVAVYAGVGGVSLQRCKRGIASVY